MLKTSKIRKEKNLKQHEIILLVFNTLIIV